MRGLRIKLRRADDGYGWDCLVGVGDLTIGAASDDKLSALNAATGLASDLVKTIEAHPELAMLLPPQATAALKALRIATAAARAGRIEDARRLVPSAVQAINRIIQNL